MMDKIKLKRHFVIVAYSYGSLIGIELVKKLEGMKLRGQLILIDGAPEQVKALTKQLIPYTTTDELHNNVLLRTIDLLDPVVSGKVSISSISSKYITIIVLIIIKILITRKITI